VLVLIVLIGRDRMYRGVLWLPRHLFQLFRKAHAKPAVSDGGAP
jgi:hypothetical protein